jgi:hypothetical protein
LTLAAANPLWLDFWFLVKAKAAKSLTKGVLRAVPMEETNTPSIAQEIIYRKLETILHSGGVFV